MCVGVRVRLSLSFCFQFSVHVSVSHMENSLLCFHMHVLSFSLSLALPAASAHVSIRIATCGNTCITRLSHAILFINHVAVCTCSWHNRPNSRLRQHVHYLIESRHTYVSVMSQVCVSHSAHVCTANCGNTCVISIILFELCNTNMWRMILVPTATSSHVTHVYESCHGCGGHMCESNYRSLL